MGFLEKAGHTIKNGYGQDTGVNLNSFAFYENDERCWEQEQWKNLFGKMPPIKKNSLWNYFKSWNYKIE